MLDVDYRPDRAVAAAVLAVSLSSATAAPGGERVCVVSSVAAYEPGAFFKRELPCLLAVLRDIDEPLAAIVIDGYVWLAHGVPGLGAHLHAALGGDVLIIGVAKRPYRDNDAALSVLRGGSETPLFVTAAGCDPTSAAEAVRAMHGAFRIPTLIKLADRICRDAAG